MLEIDAAMSKGRARSLLHMIRGGIAAITVMLQAIAAGAATISYEASGVINHIDSFTGSPNDIVVGDPFSVFLTLDDAATDVDLEPIGGEFWNVLEASVSVGSTNATGNASIFDLEQISENGIAQWTIGGDEDGTLPRAPFDGSYFLTSLALSLEAFDAMDLDPNSVWTPLPGLSTGSPMTMSLLACSSETGSCNAVYGLVGSVTSFAVVPEPCSAMLVGLGLLGLAIPVRAVRGWRQACRRRIRHLGPCRTGALDRLHR
jgi:hypothetical protein